MYVWRTVGALPTNHSLALHLSTNSKERRVKEIFPFQFRPNGFKRLAKGAERARYGGIYFSVIVEESIRALAIKGHT